MKNKILALGLVLALVVVMVIPVAASAATTTDVTGTVASGYVFNAPGAIALGSMTPSGTPYTGQSTDGLIQGNNAAGYTVTGIDAKGTNTGFLVSGSNTLHNKLRIGPAASPTSTADTQSSFVNTSGVTDQAVGLYVSQIIAANDVAASGYTITITFTVTAK